MPKKSLVEIADYNYKVIAEPLSFDGKPVEGYKAILREDNRKILHIASKTYGIVQNNSVIDLAEESFRQSNLPSWKRVVRIADSGRRMFACYDFDRKLEVKKVGDMMGLRLTVNNSFDGSSPVSFELGFLRLVCMNGAKAFKREFNVSKKHTSNIDLDSFRLNLASAMITAEDQMGLFGQMAEKSISHEQGEKLISRMVKNHVFSERVSKGVLEVWQNPRHKEDKGRNLYNLLNAITDYATHDIAEKRFELSERITGNATDYLSRLTEGTALTLASELVA